MESLNLAAIWNLNFVLVIENNQYAVSTRIEESTRETDLYKRGIALGVESHLVDGNDPIAVHELMQDAVAKCRRGEGPIVIEARTYRHMGHHVNDPGKYMPADKLAYYKERDPVDLVPQCADRNGRRQRRRDRGDRKRDQAGIRGRRRILQGER